MRRGRRSRSGGIQSVTVAAARFRGVREWLIPLGSDLSGVVPIRGRSSFLSEFAVKNFGCTKKSMQTPCLTATGEFIGDQWVQGASSTLWALAITSISILA